MWKNTMQVGNTIMITNMKKEISTIALEALTLHIQVENFQGTKNDEEFSYIKKKLIHYLETLGNIKPIVQDKAELSSINEIESNIKHTITDLEKKAIVKLPKPHNLKDNLVKTHSFSKLPLEYERSELLKAESILQQVKKEVNSLETNLAAHTNTENLSAVNNLEGKIVSIYTDLENIEDSKSNNELKKIRDELYRDLIRCSGKLKKVRRRSSVTSTDVKAIQEGSKAIKGLENIKDAQLKDIENRNSFEDLSTRINTLTRQISQTLNGDERNGSQVAVKIKVEALKLAWESLKQHLYSENVSVDLMIEIIDELDDLIKDFHLNNKQFKKYVMSHRSDWRNSGDVEKKRLKEIVEHLKVAKRKIACFQGYYKDASYVELEKEIKDCGQMLQAVESGSDIKTNLAKVKIQHKIMEYLELLDEKSVKI